MRTSIIAALAAGFLASNSAIAMDKVIATPLAYQDQPLATATFANGKTMALTIGIGSGAFGDRTGTMWTITDRGPNIDCGEAQELIGLDETALCGGNKKAKIFPVPSFTPTIYKLTIGDDGRASIAQAIALKGRSGAALSGLSNPLQATTTEGAYDAAGKALTLTPNGFDSEALVRLSDGSFWLSEEYGGSIAHVAADGTVMTRYVPAGLEQDYAGADYEVKGALPALVMMRNLNRGIESLAISADEKTLWFAMQSPLANPDADAYKSSRNVRLFAFDIASERVTGEWLYPLDLPETFGKDNAKKKRKQSDVKVSELAALPDGSLLVLERISKTTKFYRVRPDAGSIMPAAFDDKATSPSLEQLDPDAAKAAGAPVLEKTLVLDTDTAEGMPSKIEGIALVSDRDMILINDNDFGIADDRTEIVRITFPAPLTN